ncbi:glyoxalase [Rhodospirillales bacterium 47_12_T64]|nr:glyoxalase [Rhodospirillales bacterium 47_12_T64]
MSAVRWLGFDHVQLAIPANSEDICRQFYKDILGWEEVAKPESLAGRGGVWFRTDSFHLHLGVDKNFRPAEKAHPAFLVMDLIPLAKILEKPGIPVEWDSKLEGYKRFYVKDAVGNRLEFMQKTA